MGNKFLESDDIDTCKEAIEVSFQKQCLKDIKYLVLVNVFVFVKILVCETVELSAVYFLHCVFLGFNIMSCDTSETFGDFK